MTLWLGYLMLSNSFQIYHWIDKRLLRKEKIDLLHIELVTTLSFPFRLKNIVKNWPTIFVKNQTKIKWGEFIKCHNKKHYFAVCFLVFGLSVSIVWMKRRIRIPFVKNTHKWLWTKMWSRLKNVSEFLVTFLCIHVFFHSICSILDTSQIPLKWHINRSKHFHSKGFCSGIKDTN